MKLGTAKIIERNKIKEESKSIMLNKSPVNINNPLINKIPPKSIKNTTNILILKESISNVNAERISIAPNNFNVDICS